jgi:alkylation response protein AidB-like acyl-CoA dehydrogenase
MGHYIANLRDIEFNLFEMNQLDDVLGAAPFEDMDRETALDVLREIRRLAEEDFAASFVDADRIKLELIDGEVKLPDTVKKSLSAIYDGGWDLLGLPKEHGGFGAPPSLRWACQEMLCGANPAVFLYASSALMAGIIASEGTEEQARRFAEPMIEKKWGSTMVLTEPQAGSDVGAGTAKAIHIEDDVYHLEGVKRFITSGEQDFSENIIHLVLARREGGPEGTKGLSMFIVPKYMVNEDGSLGERNGVFATNLEDKMGIRGSTTCELTFGVDTPAVGYLVGGVHDGIRQMFRVIEDARMLIGTKSAATLSTGYLNALEYAKVRVQSADLTKASDKTAPRVEIIRHPDVRRLLMLQKAYAEGMRALVLYTAHLLDLEAVGPDSEERAKRNDLFLPLVKGYCSEKGYELLTQSLQVLGGSGYTRDYPMEQYIRDAKIDTIYEGTTAIQSLDLFFRKIVRDQGATLGKLAGEIVEVIKGGHEELEAERALLGTALEDVQAHVSVLVGHAMASQQEPTEIYKTGLHTNALLESISEVVIAWLLIQQAGIALNAIGDASESDKAFYEGKIASAKFFVHDAMPKARLRREAAEAEDGSLMTMPDAAF